MKTKDHIITIIDSSHVSGNMKKFINAEHPSLDTMLNFGIIGIFNNLMHIYAHIKDEPAKCQSPL